MKRPVQLALWAAAILAGWSAGVFARPETSSAPAAMTAAANAAAPRGASGDAAVNAVFTVIARRNNFRQLAQVGTLLLALDERGMREVMAKVDAWPAAERR